MTNSKTSPKGQNRQQKIEVTLTGQLAKQYSDLVTCADSLGVELNLFDKDFEEFMGKQLRSFGRQLQRIKVGSLVLKRTAQE